jgi:hypothetical protein
MEDHWFIFEEDDVVHLVRSWTGLELFAVPIHFESLLGKGTLREHERGHWRAGAVIVFGRSLRRVGTLTGTRRRRGGAAGANRILCGCGEQRLTRRGDSESLVVGSFAASP